MKSTTVKTKCDLYLSDMVIMQNVVNMQNIEMLYYNTAIKYFQTKVDLGDNVNLVCAQ